MKPSNLSSQLLVRSLEDLLDAERRWRQAAERRAKALTEVLTRLAYDLGLGEALEQARRTHPRALETWDAADWKQVFQRLNDHPTAWTRQGPDPKQIETLQRENKRLKALVQDLASQVQHLQAQIQRLQTAQSAVPIPSIGLDILAQGLVDIDWDGLKVPSLYQPQAKTGSIRWRRGLMMVFLIARFGVNARMELALALARAFGKEVSTTRSWIRKAGQFMVQQGFLMEALLQGGKVSTSLTVYRLTDEGRALARRLGWEPVESEWDRLIRLHEGDRYPAHTMAVLAVAMHARLRGWRAAVLPEHQSPSPPDIYLAQGEEGWYVEVELSRKDNRAKWEHNARANGGTVALVAATAQHRRTLVQDCKRLGLSGVATDLETLIATPLAKITPETPFWVEEWP